MIYTKFTIETTVEAEDILSSVLADCGIEGLEIADSKPWTREELDEIFVDEVPTDPNIPEGIALISFYLSEDDDKGTILKDVRLSLEDMRAFIEVPCGTLNISSSDLKDEDYINSWKQYFHAFSIDLFAGRKLGIVPSWEEAPEISGSSDILIHIDPGTAFGTGAHETTKLCIIDLSEYVTAGCRVLDIGTGSGILSMAAFMMGAGSIAATELDKNAIPAVKENFEKNGLSNSPFRLVMGDLVSDPSVRDDIGGNYDIVVANILPTVLIPLTPVMKDLVRKEGTVIYSGILTEKAPAVRQALTENGFDIIDEKVLGEWCAITAKA